MCEHERLHYVIAVYLMSIILSICNVDNLTDSEEHTLWEYESDLALLDIPMKVCFPVIYKIIKRNRMNCIKNDNDMKTLLCGNKVWIHVVELFKSDEIYRACDIVQMSTLDTIYIHQSVDLVALLFNSVLKCAEQFPNNKDLQVKSAGIVLRLLANKIHAIKRTTYNLVANSLKRRLCATESCSKTTTNLCLLLGIPLNTEIVVEILCFGLGHSDSSVSYINIIKVLVLYIKIFQINSNAEIILQTLLRAKCIYEENWLQILEILRPVLPILPCICEKNEKLSKI